MNIIEWSFVIIWPIAALVFYNFLADHQMKHMARVTCENFNRTGQALEIVLGSVREIERALEKMGVKIDSPIDSKGGQEVWRVAR